MVRVGVAVGGEVLVAVGGGGSVCVKAGAGEAVEIAGGVELAVAAMRLLVGEGFVHPARSKINPNKAYQKVLW